MINLAIFDLGNVLYLNHFDRAFAHWAEASGRAPEAFQRFMALDAVHAAFECGTLTPQQFHEAFCQSCDVVLPFESFAVGWNAIYGDYIPGTREAIRQLKQHMPVVALTNTNALHCPTWQERYAEELSLFDVVYISNEMGMRKPDTAIFEEVLSRQGVRPEATLFFDDNPTNVAAARTLGIRAYEVTGPESIPRVLSMLTDA